MARRIINPAQGAEAAGEKVEGMPGGAPGIPEEAPPTQAAPIRLERDPEELAKLPTPKTYRVAASKNVLYGGVPTVLRAGKTVSDATHDLQTLRAQGVVLEEVQHGH